MNITKYTKATLGTLSRTEIETSDLCFKAFHKVRGTTTYFKSKKKDLFSMMNKFFLQN